MKAVVNTLLVCSLVALVAMPEQAVAQEMTMKEYKIQVQQQADREQAANNEIAKCDAEIANLKSQIADIEGQITATWGEIYSAIGVTEADVNAYRDRLNGLERDLNAMGALSPEDLWQRRKEINGIEVQLEEAKNDKIYVLSEMKDKVAALEGKIAQLRAKMPKGMYDEYTVNRGDYLWRISRSSDVYGDPMQWVRIYSYNRDQIKDPDLIYPDQIFKIHRDNAPNEYLVGSGDNLAKIAGSMDVMGDPTKWRALYEANKDVVGDDPGLIYPYQILKFPTN